MSQNELNNIAASVRQRLLNRARSQGEEYQLLLERYVQERFLHRLEISPHEGEFILKGATLFIIWQGKHHRVTRDMDFLRTGPMAADRLKGSIQRICRTDVKPDGVTFLPDSVQINPIREDQVYEGLRARIEARVGSARIRLQVDVGFGDATWPPPERTPFPVLLEDFQAPRPRTYPKESVVAEKLQAMVDLGMANSRMKDFYDVWFLAERFRFEGEVLTEAVRRTFERRRTPLPEGLPLAFTEEFARDRRKRQQWGAFVRKARISEEKLLLADVTGRIERFLIEPLHALCQGEPFYQEWPPGGPWQDRR